MVKKCVIILTLIGLFGISMTGWAAEKELKIIAEAWYFDKYPLEEATENFIEDHPEVTIEWSKTGDFEVAPLMLAWSRDNYVADIAIVATPAEAVSFQAKGLLVDFEDVLKGEYAKDQWLEGFLSDCTIDDKVYAIPTDGEIMTLIVRKDYATEAGLTDESGNIIPPKTLDDFYNYLQKLTIKDESGATVRYGMDVNWSREYMILTYFSGIQALRGTIYDENNDLDFSSQEALDLLTFWQRSVEEGLISTSSLVDHSGPRNSMKSGLAAIMWEDHARVVEVGKVVGHDKLEIMPIPDALTNGTIGYCMSLMIPKTAQNIELAKAFILEQLNADWFAHYLMDNWGKLLGLKRPLEGRQEQLVWRTVSGILENTESLPHMVDHARLVDIVTTEIQNMLKMEQTPEETLTNIRQKSENLNLVN
jgi:ABC-type glycerol-3-phosphate transport system substrate-binding protein